MSNIFKNSKGMNIVGQGGKIILFMLPSLLAALAVHKYFRQIAKLPDAVGFLRSAGYILLAPGLVLWAAAMIQLLSDFPKGKLVKTGAYGVVRNPIYSSVTFFILPGVSLITLTWVYLVASVFLYAGVIIFIRKEEKNLLAAFGGEYEEYLEKVNRMIPFKKPGK
jgi:protein-S-isoprenylcysteine O-methyltransferase Ste14